MSVHQPPPAPGWSRARAWPKDAGSTSPLSLSGGRPPPVPPPPSCFLLSRGPVPAGRGRMRFPCQESTRASSWLYQGSNAARQASHVWNARPAPPRVTSHPASCSSSSAVSAGFHSRCDTSISSITTARSTELHVACSLASASEGWSSASTSSAAARMQIRPPIEWPISTHRSIPAARTASSTSEASAAGLKSAGWPSGLSPWPRRSSAMAG
mmetsp:Transcript_10557/g.35036  ORF Transcript_10557/g.35036 Transcript_10557/m.35036 type:complete len:212 (+) Transcript_10557:679-1314(+)